MDKTMNGSAAGNKDFKNTPHVAQTEAPAKTSNQFADMKEMIADKAGPAMDYVRNLNVGPKAQEYAQSAGALVRQYPFYALVGGLVVGAMIGMAIARPSNRA